MIGQTDQQQHQNESTEQEFEKRSCTSCGTSNTSLWRRFQGNIVCNACGLYLKANGQKRPDWLQQRQTTKHRKSNSLESTTMFFHWHNDSKQVSCSNCQTTTSSLWRKNDQNMHVCNSCWLWKKMHGYNRPLEMKSNVIKRRKRLSASIPKSESDQLQNSPQPFENQGRRLHHPYPQEGRPLHVDPQRYGRALHPQDPKPSHPQNRPFPPGFARHPNAPSNVCIQRPRPIDAQSAHSQGYDSRPVYSQGYDPQDSTSVRSVPLDRMPPPARQSQPVRIQSSILTSPYPRHGYSASCPGTTMPYHAGYRSPDHSSDTTSSHVQERQSHVSSEYKIVELKEWPSVDKQDDIKEEEIYSGASEKYPNLPVYYQPQTQPITPVASPVRKDTPWEKASGAMSVMNLLN